MTIVHKKRPSGSHSSASQGHRHPQSAIGFRGEQDGAIGEVIDTCPQAEHPGLNAREPRRPLPIAYPNRSPPMRCTLPLSARRPFWRTRPPCRARAQFSSSSPMISARPEHRRRRSTDLRTRRIARTGMRFAGYASCQVCSPRSEHPAASPAWDHRLDRAAEDADWKRNASCPRPIRPQPAARRHDAGRSAAGCRLPHILRRQVAPRRRGFMAHGPRI